MIIKLKKCDLLFDNSVISLLEGYKSKVKKGEIGRNLESILKNKDINKIKNLDLLFYILQTKRPKIYAESGNTYVDYGSLDGIIPSDMFLLKKQPNYKSNNNQKEKYILSCFSKRFMILLIIDLIMTFFNCFCN